MLFNRRLLPMLSSTCSITYRMMIDHQQINFSFYSEINVVSFYLMIKNFKEWDISLRLKEPIFIYQVVIQIMIKEMYMYKK